MRRAGFDPLTVAVAVPDHKAYYPGAHELRIQVTGDREHGAQMLGHWRSGVATRIDLFAAALFSGLAVDELNDLDLSYTPPLGSPWDQVQMAAQVWARATTKRPRLTDDGVGAQPRKPARATTSVLTPMCPPCRASPSAGGSRPLTTLHNS